MKDRHIVLLVCLGVASFLGIFVGIFMLVNSALKGQVYEQSLENVRASSELRQHLGTPIDSGYMVMGNISTSGGSGRADISYTVHGPSGSAKVYVLATKALGAWSITEQVVDLKNASERVPLVVDGRPTGAPFPQSRQ